MTAVGTDETGGLPDTGGRLLWLDLAKATAIVAVVGAHVCTKYALPLELSSGDVMWLLIAAFEPIPMPLFFLVSGLLAASSLSMPLVTLLHRKVLMYYYVYVVWLSLQSLFFLLFPEDYTVPTQVARSARGLLAQLLVAPGNLWYLWSLAIIFPIARLGRRARIPTLIAAMALATAAATGLMGVSSGNVKTFLLSLPWFLVGAYFSREIVGIAKASTVNRAAAGVAILALVALGNLGVRVVAPPAIYGAAYIAACTVAMWACIQVFPVLAARLVPGRQLTTAVSSIGVHTVRIYVIHVPVIAAFGLLTQLLIPAGLTLGGPTLLGLAVLVTALVTGLSLLCGAIISAIAPFLFTPPGWLVRLGRDRREPAAPVTTLDAVDPGVPGDSVKLGRQRRSSVVGVFRGRRG